MSPKFSFGDDFQMTSNSPDDPRMKRRWGSISALPSECLLHFRKGKLLTDSSGQAATCFKRWKDTVFIIPTSLKEIIFEANQLTRDNVDVRIRGMAVYRIHDPLKIYKLINFSNRQRAEEKLARMIADLCRSNAKWLVANMGVEECIRKRKEEIAEALRQEVSRVVTQRDEEPEPSETPEPSESSDSPAEDEAPPEAPDPSFALEPDELESKGGGWGVKIMTIDIQDVYIQDEEIFSAMQMLFKAEKLRASRLAELEMEKELESRELELKRQLAEQRKQTSLEEARIEAEIAEEKLKLTRQNEEKKFELDRYRVEQQESIEEFKLQQALEKERQRAQLELDKAKKETEAQKLRHDGDIEYLQNKIQVENQASPQSLERHFIEQALPQLAQTLAESMKDLKMHVYQSDGEGPHSPLSYALRELLQVWSERLQRIETPEGSAPDEGR